MAKPPITDANETIYRRHIATYTQPADKRPRTASEEEMRLINDILSKREESMKLNFPGLVTEAAKFQKAHQLLDTIQNPQTMDTESLLAAFDAAVQTSLKQEHDTIKR